MATIPHETEFNQDWIDTMQNQDAPLANHIRDTTRSSELVNHRGWRQRAIDRVVAFVLKNLEPKKP